MTASVIVSIVALILCSAMTVAVTVLVSKALSRAFLALDSMHARQGQQLSGLLDRFQAIRWEDLAGLRATNEDDQEGGFFPPEEEGEVTQEIPGVWGKLRDMRERLSEEEQALLDEDFTLEGNPR